MPNTVTEDTALSVRTEQSFELAPTGAVAGAQYEIQSAIVVAKKFPRNEDAAFEKLMKAAGRTSFAEDAAYSFPRGGTAIEGPSVNLAREAARIWGNVRYGIDIVRDDSTSRQIRAWAWDVETNTRVSAEDEFEKLVQRKSKGGTTNWVKPDERDLRELTNRRGAILVRNCLLSVLPKDLIEDALARCRETLRRGAETDPESARKRIILAFSELNVTPEMLEHKFGHRLSECSPAEIAELRKIYRSIADGNSTWSEYVVAEKPEATKATVNVADIKAGAEPNRGHGRDGLDAVAKKAAPNGKKPVAAPSNPDYSDHEDPPMFGE
jgi:hypothetical protein